MIKSMLALPKLRQAVLPLRRLASSAALAQPSAVATNRFQLSPSDFLPMTEYAPVRKSFYLPLRRSLLEQRRLLVGPHASLCFQSYDTMWIQAHEMVYIERGDATQFEDECLAYAPLVPNGKTLCATFMFEIDNPTLRRRKLVDYSGVEKHMLLEADGAPLVRGVSVVDDTDSTAKDGKTAAVHFLQFPFDNSSLLERLKNAQRVTFRVTHPQYMHSADLPPAAIAAIKHDLAL